MALRKTGSLAPWGGPLLRQNILQNDDVFTEDDMCKEDSNGFLTTDSVAGAGVFGHVDTIVTFDGVGLTSDGSGGTFSGTFTADSSNQTTGGKASANVDVSQFAIYSASQNGTIGANNTDKLGYYIDLADENTLNESTGASTAAQMYIWGVDPADSTRPMVSIFESSVFTLI